MNEFTIGVLDGMGTYATINMFKQYADVFKAEKEWERPRIIIDNRCTMPSRVRAFLYKENVDELISEMFESMQYLIDAGATRIILACNTSHLFLPQIYDKIPQLKDRVVNIIDNCVDEIKKQSVKSVYLLGSEGIIQSRIYQDNLLNSKIECITPLPKEYILIRNCIEAVKQNKYNHDIKETFLGLVNKYDACVLGCTELPVLYEMYKDDILCEKIYDQLYLSIIKLKEEYDAIR